MVNFLEQQFFFRQRSAKLFVASLNFLPAKMDFSFHRDRALGAALLQLDIVGHVLYAMNDVTEFAVRVENRRINRLQ
jgi:hypothetical protein